MMRRQAKPPPSFPALVQAFFVEHLTQQRALSPRTVAAYRDAFMLFLGFAEARLGRSPALLTLPDITPDLIMAFLDHLERDRHNSVRSRNARLAALRSFLKFAAHRDVSSLQVIEHALGVPAKRFERPMLGYLSREEMLAVIGAPDGTWFSQRDHVLLLMLYNTGARVSEIVGVKVGDVVLDDAAACVHLHGKGRKDRSVPLWQSTAAAVRSGWSCRSCAGYTAPWWTESRSNWDLRRSSSCGGKHPTSHAPKVQEHCNDLECSRSRVSPAPAGAEVGDRPTRARRR